LRQVKNTHGLPAAARDRLKGSNRLRRD
jgi:hypothetical protein